MRNFRLICFVIFCAIFACRYCSFAAEPMPNSLLTLAVDEKGSVRVEMNLTIPVKSTSTNQYSTGKSAVWIVPLPLAINPNSKIISAPDVRISPIALGSGYSLLAIISPHEQHNVRFQIDTAASITESPEGKGKVEFDLTFPYMSKTERDLLELPVTLASYGIMIQLPKKYDETEIGFSTPIFQKASDRSFSLSSEMISSAKLGKVWIVFPNPMQRSLEIAKFAISLLFGVFTLLFHIQALRDRKISWSFGVLAVSIVLLLAAFFYTYALPKRFEFLVYAAAAIPHALYGFFASMYLLFANAHQATIAGYVTIDGQPAIFAEVVLMTTNGNTKKEVRRTDALKQGGQFQFFVWPSKNPGQWFVKVQSKGTTEIESQKFSLKAGEKHEVKPCDLKLLPSTVGQTPIPNAQKEFQSS